MKEHGEVMRERGGIPWDGKFGKLLQKSLDFGEVAKGASQVHLNTQASGGKIEGVGRRVCFACLELPEGMPEACVQGTCATESSVLTGALVPTYMVTSVEAGGGHT